MHIDNINEDHIVDSIIDNVFDLFDTAMYRNDEAGINLSLKLAEALIPELSVDVIISILSITLPIQSMLARHEFANEAVKVITKRCPKEAYDILRGLY